MGEGMLIRQLFAGELPKLVMFDLDGTLIDSVPDLAIAIDEMLVSLDLHPAGAEKTKVWIGNGIPNLIQQALVDAGATEESIGNESAFFLKAKSFFDQAYDKSCGRYSVIYSRVEQTLSKLQKMNVTLAVITNKSERFTGGLLSDLGLDHYFSMVVCGDTLPKKKPDPAPLEYVMQKFNIKPEQALMVGDSRHDIAAARAAGVASVAVPYGYNHGDPVASSEPSLLVESLFDLVQEKAI